MTLIGNIVIVLISLLSGAYLKEKGMKPTQLKFWLFIIPISVVLVTIVTLIEHKLCI